MSIFNAIIEAVTGNIQDPSDYEYESDDDDDSYDKNFIESWKSEFGLADEQKELEPDDTSDESENKPWWVGLGCVLPSQDAESDERSKGWFGLW